MNWRSTDDVRRDYIIERRRLDLRPDDDPGLGILEAFELGYRRGLAEGRQLERAAIVALLRVEGPIAGGVAWQTIARIARDIERADHLRPDIKDGEGKT